MDFNLEKAVETAKTAKTQRVKVEASLTQREKGLISLTISSLAYLFSPWFYFSVHDFSVRSPRDLEVLTGWGRN